MIKGKKEFFFQDNFLTNAGVVVVCLGLFIIFPTKNIFEQIVSAAAFLLLTPFFYVKIILRKKIGDYGVGIGEWKTGLIWSAISLVICLLIFYLLFNYFDFSQKYYQYFFRESAGNFWIFVLYELAVVGFFYAIYDFFFRGFFIFSFKKYFGYWVIIAQPAVFFLYFFISGSLNWSVVPILVFSPFAGIITYFSGSILFSLISSVLLNIMVDIVVINAFK